MPCESPHADDARSAAPDLGSGLHLRRSAVDLEREVVAMMARE
jgi:hypothetical protein